MKHQIIIKRRIRETKIEEKKGKINILEQKCIYCI